jgi:polar amino acid transport system substrate-binding protein
MLYEITEPLNIEIDWERAPFARCLLYLQSNKVDVVNVASYKPEREAYGVFPTNNGKIDVRRRFKYDTYYAFVKAESKARYNGSAISNLGPLPVAVEIKAAIIPSLEQMGLQIMQQPEAKFSFGMLELDRVSAVVTNQYNGLKYADMNIRRLEPALSERAYYLLFSKVYYKDNTDLVERIWYMSGQLQEHIYQQTLQKYASLPGWPNDLAD